MSGDFGMKRAILGVALVAAALAGSDAAAAQNVAAPAAESAVPPAASAAPPAASAAPPAEAASGPIAALQQQLKQEGFAPGPVNGVMTEETRRALAAAQRRAGQRSGAIAAAGSGEPDPVKRVQAGLQQLGLFAGPIDGVVGAQTRDAIIRFEAARHLAVDPRVSDRLLAALEEAGVNPGTAAPAAPGSPAEAAPATAAQTAPPEAPPDAAIEATGRRALPPGVNPPPIR
jgi:peptidoglycan hydrolase-like protein with peptidoglycan-binding domain